MARIYFSSTVDINSFNSLPNPWGNDLYSMGTHTAPTSYYNLGLYRGNQYTYQMYIYHTGNGTVSIFYPYSTGGVSSVWSYYICSGPYSVISLTANPTYPQLFRYWYVNGYGVWTYTQSFNLGVNDWPVVNANAIYAVFY
jgi:hypothetical protein